VRYLDFNDSYPAKALGLNATQTAHAVAISGTAFNALRVNVFVDHSQIVQLECPRSGIWGTKSLWGRVLTYEDSVTQAGASLRRPRAGR
jgi:hypothetical protein